MYLELQLVNEYERGPGSSGERDNAVGNALTRHSADAVMSAVGEAFARHYPANRRTVTQNLTRPVYINNLTVNTTVLYNGTLPSGATAWPSPAPVYQSLPWHSGEQQYLGAQNPRVQEYESSDNEPDEDEESDEEQESDEEHESDEEQESDEESGEDESDEYSSGMSSE
ncbi:hypothetical protein CONLIGDRAFT_710373 [Coniochaeta ligniaria NRRL 30616]|uniref:Uncharacterized protein n=1 Tax=Coniochaeta ligniaria NRRL 30616 TaxID=1408157 RepID=A0A1J7K0A3_9PEZI|nr:hypothetical protein CONLIGDRAFT_710373 [Coniochaeta ligniaria NRRL 30616]